MSACCGLDRRNAAIVVLSLLLAGAITGWVLEARRPPQTVELAVPQAVEMVNVLVAAKDLALGTAFTKENVAAVTTSKKLPKEALPAGFASDTKELIGKRLFEYLPKGVVIHSGNASRHHPPLWGEGYKITDLLMLTPTYTQPSLVPGARFDILVGFRTNSDGFILIPDLHILAVTVEEDLGRMKHNVPAEATVTFAMSENEAALLNLAEKANCTFQFYPHPLGAPERQFDYDKTLTKLKELVKSPQPIGPPTPRDKR